MLHEEESLFVAIPLVSVATFICILARRRIFKSSNPWLVLVLGVLIGSIPGFFLNSMMIFPYKAHFLAGHNTVECPPKSFDTNGTMRLHRNAAEINEEPELSHPSWCPSANCTNTDLCHPCQRRFLILIAMGRSASTTLT